MLKIIAGVPSDPNDGFLYAKEGDVEIWTRIDDGESAVSVRGLARMCGKNDRTIHDLLKKIEAQPQSFKLSKTLKPFAGKTSKPQGFPAKKQRKSRGSVDVKPVRADVAWSIISHYARKGSEVAHDTLDAIGQIGMTSYLQGKTGWLPQNMQASKDARTQVDRILEDPLVWEGIYPLDVIEKINRWYPPYKQKEFFWTYFYRFLTNEERQKLDKLNPIDPATNQRKHRIHQYLEPHTRERLKAKILIVTQCVRSADSLTAFHHRYQLLYGEDVHKDRTADVVKDHKRNAA